MKISDKIKDVALFHDTFLIGNRQKPTAAIGQEAELRYNLMKEENDEYLEACRNNDLIEVADALGDQLYILLGTILRHGLQDKIEAVFDEIQLSNMSKLDQNGKPIFREDGKILKGPNYFKPNISKVLD
jgi:predicted HAD superfamily Cof-like phosphohydrolase